MLLVSWWLSILYILVTIVTIISISRSTASNDWGDALSGLMYQQVILSTLGDLNVSGPKFIIAHEYLAIRQPSFEELEATNFGLVI